MILTGCILSLLMILNGNDFEKQIKHYLINNMTDYDSIHVVSYQLPENEIKLLPGLNRRGNMVSIPYEVYSGSVRRIKLLDVTVELYKKVTITSVDIPAGEKIDKSNSVTVLKDISASRYNPEAAPDGMIRASRYIKKGSILSSLNSEKIPVIAVGQKVKAHMISGNIEIKIDAVSRQEGSIGEIIQIKSADNKQFKAEVIDGINVLITE